MAARYWVGGSGNWQAGNTANWSATSGGAGGASVPTAADTANFNAASGGGVVTVVGDMPCLSFTTAGFTGAIVGGASGGYISHYSGSCTIASNTAVFECGIRNRATGTTAYTLTIACAATRITMYEKLGSGTATYTVSHTSSGSCYIENVNRTTTTGTLTFTNSNSTSFGQLFFGYLGGGTLNLTGNTIFNGGTIYQTTFQYGLTINLNAGGTIAFNQGIYFSGGVTINLYKTLTINTSAGTYACNFAPSCVVNLYTGASWTTDGQNTSVTVDCNVNVTAGLFRLYHATASVSTQARVTLSGGTFQFGGASATQTYIGSLAVTGTGSKTLAYNSTTLNYLAVNGGALTLSGTGTTFPAAAWFIYHYNAATADTSRLTLENNVTASFLRLSCHTAYGSYLMLGTGYSLGVYSLTMVASGTAIGVGLASISASVAGTGNATESNRYFLYGYQTNVPTLASTVMAIFSYTDFYNITSAVSVTPTRAGDCGGNTNIVFASPVTRYWVGSGGSNWSTNSWSTSSGGAVGASVPLVQDTVYMDAGSAANLIIETRVPSAIYNTNATRTISASISVIGKTILFKDFETIGSVTGNLGLGPTGTAKNLKLFATSGTQVSIDGANLSGVDVGASGSRVWALSGNVNCGVSNVNSRFYITTPITLDTNNYGITCAGFYVQTAGCSGSFGTSTIAANDVGFNYSGFTISSVTWTPNTSSVASSSNIASFVSVVDIYKYLVTSSSTIGTISINSASGRTIGELASERTNSWILYTQYTGIKVNKWSISGSSTTSRVIVVASFEYTGINVVSADYLEIQDSIVTPSTNTWYAGTHSLDSGGNSGWIFTAPPSGNSLFFGSNF